MWRSGGGAWRRRQRRAPSLSAMTDEQMQRVVLAVVLREYPVLLTFPALAFELSRTPPTSSPATRSPGPSATS